MVRLIMWLVEPLWVGVRVSAAAVSAFTRQPGNLLVDIAVCVSMTLGIAACRLSALTR
jgi:hypothetical protein